MRENKCPVQAGVFLAYGDQAGRLNGSTDIEKLAIVTFSRA
jgi:hypothetical protein